MKRFIDTPSKIAIIALSISSILLFYVGCERHEYLSPPKPKEIPKKVEAPKKPILKVEKKEFPYRKYTYIKDFYSPLMHKMIEISLKYNIPPAATLAIAGVESGYGRGYVAKITGNILSLGARMDEKELPALYLPTLIKTKEVLYDPKKIKKYKKTQLIWKRRPKSLKKDYRPLRIAGTKKELAYFDYHEDRKIKAQLRCIEDFATKWISEKKPFLPFQEARRLLDDAVKKDGKEALFDEKLNKAFINTIGGRQKSFNYRKTWPVKVKTIMKKADLIRLTKVVYETKLSLDEVW